MCSGFDWARGRWRNRRSMAVSHSLPSASSLKLLVLFCGSGLISRALRWDKTVMWLHALESPPTPRFGLPAAGGTTVCSDPLPNAGHGIPRTPSASTEATAPGGAEQRAKSRALGRVSPGTFSVHRRHGSAALRGHTLNRRVSQSGSVCPTSTEFSSREIRTVNFKPNLNLTTK